MGYRIAQVGSFDVENYGDLLFADVLEKQIRQKIEIDEIVYFAPKSCVMPYRTEKVHAVTELEEMAEKEHFDAIIVGGGDLVQLKKILVLIPHISPEMVEYEGLYMWVIPAIVAQKYNIPLLWNALGVPFALSEADKEITTLLCETVDYISVRDYEAKSVLSEAVESERINVVPDTVLSISSLIPKCELDSVFEKLPLNIETGKYVFFQANNSLKEKDIEICAETLKKIKQTTGYEVVLQPIGYALGDAAKLEEIYKKYPGEFIFSENNFSQYEILSLVANAGLYIGTSLHGCITSNSYGVNNIVYNINHYNKIDGFVSLVNAEKNRVYLAEEIWPAFEKQHYKPKVDLNLQLQKIGQHFTDIAKYICKGEKTRRINYSKDLAECIFNTHNIEQDLLTRNYDLSVEVERLRTENQILREQFQQWKEVTYNSRSWKVTKPLRKIMSIIKKGE